MDFVIKYQKDNKKLEELLNSINRPGEFYTHDRIGVPMPSITVKKVGILSFPLPESQMQKLVKVADVAPYGKGTETLVDVSVRNCLEINTNQMTVGGRTWKETLQELTTLASTGLGLEYDRIEPSLYKLLIYETGGFFLPHRDTEKSDGMLATLTVSLPVEGTGGELVVQHQDQVATVEMNVDNPSELAFAAFYADCQHEIKPVTSGYRVALIYNLSVKPSNIKAPIKSPDYTAKVDSIATELNKWCNRENTANKLVWVFEHAYSQAGLSFDTLKNGDKAVASAICLASEKTECEPYAAILHINELFEAWPDSGYWNRYSNDYEVGELIEHSIGLDDWSSPKGHSPKFGPLTIDDFELMPLDSLMDAIPNEEEFEEATGNAGATLDRTYHFAALVMFKRRKISEILVKQSRLAAVAWIDEEIIRKNGVIDDEITTTAENIIECWPPSKYIYETNTLNSAVPQMLLVLAKIKNSQLSVKFMQATAIKHYEKKYNPAFKAVLITLEPRKVEATLATLLSEQFEDQSAGALQLITQVGQHFSNIDNWNQRIYRKCAENIMKGLSDFLSTKERKVSYYYGVPHKKFALRQMSKSAIQDLFLIFLKANDLVLTEQLIYTLENFPQEASLFHAAPRALNVLSNNNDLVHSQAFASLWNLSASSLLSRSSTPPRMPRHWTISCTVTCECDHCDQLRKFCDHPVKKTKRFKLRLDIRKHLAKEISVHQLDLDRKTEKIGSPHTLVCTKNRDGFKRRLKEYHEDVNAMKLLTKIAGQADASDQYSEAVVELNDAIAMQASLNKKNKRYHI